MRILVTPKQEMELKSTVLPREIFFAAAKRSIKSAQWEVKILYF